MQQKSITTITFKLVTLTKSKQFSVYFFSCVRNIGLMRAFNRSWNILPINLKSWVVEILSLIFNLLLHTKNFYESLSDPITLTQSQPKIWRFCLIQVNTTPYIITLQMITSQLLLFSCTLAVLQVWLHLEAVYNFLLYSITVRLQLYYREKL